jgi:hypothetical protein
MVNASTRGGGCILLTRIIYEFRVILTINSDYFPKPVNLCSGDKVSFLKHMN